MRATTVRRIVAVVFVGGVAGMIAMSIGDNDGGAVTFGLICVAGALCLIATTSVHSAAEPDVPLGFDDEAAEQLEERISQLVAAGAKDGEVRDLVRLAVRLGRGAR